MKEKRKRKQDEQKNYKVGERNTTKERDIKQEKKEKKTKGR